MNLNKAMIIGNLTRDPEIKTLPSGQSVANFSIATNFVWKDSQTGEEKKVVEFHNVVAWRKLAEICGQYLKKGAKVYIEGRLQTRSWDDQNGVKHYKTEINTENMIMLDRPSGNTTNNNVPVQKQSNSTQFQSQEYVGGEVIEEIQVENIPF